MWWPFKKKQATFVGRPATIGNEDATRARLSMRLDRLQKSVPRAKGLRLQRLNEEIASINKQLKIMAVVADIQAE